MIGNSAIYLMVREPVDKVRLSEGLDEEESGK